MKRRFNFLTVGIVILMLLSLALSFPAVAEPVGKVINVIPSKIVSIAKLVFMVALGLFLITSGVAAMSVPVVGISLIIVGLTLIGIYAIPFFKGSNSPE